MCVSIDNTSRIWVYYIYISRYEAVQVSSRYRRSLEILTAEYWSLPITAEIEREKQKAKEVRRDLDEQIKRKQDLLAQKKAQEDQYCKEQEVSTGLPVVVWFFDYAPAIG